jgi:hypothetical protein
MKTMGDVSESLSNTARNSRREFMARYRGHGIASALEWAGWHHCVTLPRSLLGRPHYSGTNVLEREWDVLVVLDGMRVDLLREVLREHGDATVQSFEPVETMTSVSGMSSGWMERTFVPKRDELSSISYITANPHTEHLFETTAVSAAEFGHVEELWKWAWDQTRGTVPARPVTDRAIAALRERRAERYIVHYMQPHFPSIPDPIGSDIHLDDRGWDNSAWEQLKRGRLSREDVWASYRANLEYVLDDVRLLLESVDVDTVALTADHGNAIGERSYWGHQDWPVPEIWTVPWCTTTARNVRDYEPTTLPPSDTDDRTEPDIDVESRLEALGYT